MRPKELTGYTTGTLRVLEYTGKIQFKSRVWLAICDPELGGCGKQVEVRVQKLTCSEGPNRKYHCGCKHYHPDCYKSYRELAQNRAFNRNADILEFLENGYSMTEIVKDLNVSSTTVNRWLRCKWDLGYVKAIRMRANIGLRLQNVYSYEACNSVRRVDVLELIENGYSKSDIAKAYGVSRERVRQIILSSPRALKRIKGVRKRYYIPTGKKRGRPPKLYTKTQLDYYI